MIESLVFSEFERAAAFLSIARQGSKNKCGINDCILTEDLSTITEGIPMG
jgi:hypothetical protein